ncbi:sodium/glutamate symporter [Cloacibacillus sp. An23]|uniref:sodium/glutamate symporter n=1 Tax=Cloacibacillus sp. An23 TaxID=1965591 RepID=UPI000B38404A|nr:sodium/glutamate symporter [Cloacibacillus sp. An23]OUO94315.1 hypothetical protein B5F39_03580 [Cloacibacillus sp. An23]
MTFWNVVMDFGIMSGLILLSQFLRARLTFMQSWFIPASLLAGLIGLLLGPNGLGIIPFSSAFGQYSGVLIALVFAALPLSQEKSSAANENVGKPVREMWSFQLIVFLGQHSMAMILGVLLFVPIFATPDGFGFMLPVGFVGGHGTAAAVGDSFAKLGWDEAMALGMTSATVGILTGLFIGIALIKYGTIKGYASYISNFVDLPKSFRTGLIPSGEREEMGKETFSSISVDPLAMHAALLFFIVFCAKSIADGVLLINKNFSLPIFSLSVLVGFLLMKILRMGGGEKYIDKKVITRLGSTFTDYLVGFGVASITPSVVVSYALPLTILFAFGVLYNFWLALWFAPRVFTKDWFEKGIFTYGWASGVAAIGITLLRVCDPNFKSTTLDDYSISYLFSNMWGELIIITFAPIMIANGLVLPYTGALVTALIIVVLVSWKVLKVFHAPIHKSTN